MNKDMIISVNDGVFKFTGVVKLSDNIEKTKEGYLKCFNVIMGRSGFQKYLGRELKGMGFKDNEVVEVWRDETEVFREETLESGEGKPVTENHPTVDVDIHNIKQLGKGLILTKLWRDGNNMVGNIIINDLNLADKVEKKILRELSLGYTTQLIREGNLVRQTNILINHLAVLKNGRAGNAVIQDGEIIEIEKEGNKMDLTEAMKLVVDSGYTLRLGDETKAEKEYQEGDEKKAKDKEKEEADKKAADEAAKEEQAKKDKEAKEAKDKEEAEKKAKDEETKKEKKGEDKCMDRNEVLGMLKDGLITSAEAKDLLTVATTKVDPVQTTQDGIYGANGTTEITGVNTVKQKDYNIVQGDEFIKHLQNMHDKNFGHDNLVREHTTHDTLNHAISVGKSYKSSDFIGGRK